MYVTEYKDGKVIVEFISAHSGHDLGVTELPHLYPYQAGQKRKWLVKLSFGIPPKRIMEGKSIIICKLPNFNFLNKLSAAICLILLLVSAFQMFGRMLVIVIKEIFSSSMHTVKKCVLQRVVGGKWSGMT